MKRSLSTAASLVCAASLILLAGCTTDPSVEAPDGSAEEAAPTEEWFDQELFDKQFAERSVVPEGPEEQPYLQTINAEMVDTAEFASEGPKKVCFANASISNPWR